MDTTEELLRSNEENKQKANESWGAYKGELEQQSDHLKEMKKISRLDLWPVASEQKVAKFWKDRANTSSNKQIGM